MKTKSLLIFLLIFSIKSYTQESDSVKITHPFQVTFVTPIGTNGIYSYKIVNQFSFNMLFGINGGVDGFELGGFMNTIKGDVDGLQIAGFSNTVTGGVDGAQISGFSNYSGAYTEGFQIAGFSNVIKDSTKSLQIAGFSNVSKGIEGAQLSGFANVSGNTDGVQISGFGNLAGDMTGFQGSGFINIAKSIEGTQAAGFINLAENVDGVQLAGFINICDSIDGIAIAPLNIIRKNGYMKLEFWTNEMFYLNSAFKSGVRKFYTVMSLGYKPGISDYDFTFGIGAGTSILLDKKNSFDIELNVSHFQSSPFRHWNYNQLNQLRFLFNLQLDKNIAIFAGPSFNLLIADNSDIADDIAPTWSFELIERKDTYVGWFGFNLGLRIL